MKKSFTHRSLQAAAVVAACTLTALWVSTSHNNFVLGIVTKLNSLAVIFAIAVALPYVCFKVLSKLYTPPASRRAANPETATPISSQTQLEAIAAQDLTMQYRGNPYVPEAIQNNEQFTPVATKYRGVSIEPEVNLQEKSDQDKTFFEERQAQKSAKPKERVKYRGAYVD